MTYDVTLHTPLRGHAHVLVAMPASTPEVLSGRFGARARRVLPYGDGSALYAVEAEWSIFPAEGPIIEVPNESGEIALSKTVKLSLEETTRNETDDFFPHPAVFDNPLELIPTVFEVGFGPLEIVAQPELEIADGVLRRVSMTFENDQHAVTLWLDFLSRSPVVHVNFYARNKEGVEDGASFLIAFGERFLPFPKLRSLDAQLETTDDPEVARLSADFDTITPAWACGALLCSSYKAADNPNVDPEVGEYLDDASQDALDAALAGPFFGTADHVPELLGVPLRTGRTDEVQKARELMLVFDRDGTRPHTSANHPHASGNQNAFGVAYSIFRNVSPRIVQAILWNAADWISRPTGYHEPAPGSLPVASFRRPRFISKTRKPWDGRSSTPVNFEILDLEKLSGTSANRNRKGHDREHFADVQFLTACWLTGNPAMLHQAKVHVGLDLAEIQAKLLKSAGSGRAEGRWFAALSQAANLLGGIEARRIVDHLIDHVPNVLRKQSENDGALQIEPPSRSNTGVPTVTVYEEALACFGLWLFGRTARTIAHQPPGEAYRAAARSAGVVLATIFQEEGRWFVPFRVGWPWTYGELSNASRYVHEGEYRAWAAPFLLAAHWLIGAGYLSSDHSEAVASFSREVFETPWQRASDVFSTAMALPAATFDDV